MRERIAVTTAIVMLVSLFIAPSQAADFNDNDYHEYLLYDMDTPEIDVLIVPPQSPYYSRDLVNIEYAVQAWEDGINALGSGWLADGITINSYTLGYDTPPADALYDPEIVVWSGEFNPVLLFGIGLEPWQNVFYGQTYCHNLDPTDPTDWHNHAGNIWASGRCDNGGSTCMVVNTNFLWLPDQENAINMYDLVAHEVGHCLGIGHVGDALDFEANNYPVQDIMSYQHDPNQAHCVSSLNILALEATYGDLLGHPEVQQEPDTFVHMNPGQYSHVDCINPPADWLDVLAGAPLVHQHPTPGSTIKGNDVTPPPPEPEDPPASLSASKGTKGKNSVVDLTWSAGGANVDIVLNGQVDATVSNGGSYTDNLGKNPSGSFTYQVCNTGTTDCSNTATVTF